MCGWGTKVCWTVCLWGSTLGIAAGQTPDISNPPTRGTRHRPVASNPAPPLTAITPQPTIAQPVPAMNTATDNLPKPQAQPGCPKLVYQDRLLTVNARGCPLDEVLNAIHDTTGVRFDGVTGMAPRVYLRLGPAPLNLVIRQLFKDSPFDYFIMGENDAPKVVRIWRIPPGVVYERGLLTINVMDSTLAEVLETIHERTGIQFEGAVASRERVAVKLGPAPPVDVLNELFRGSHLNFVMLGQGDSSRTDLRVILSPAQEGATTESFVTAEAPQPDAPVVGRGRRRFVQAQSQTLDQPQPDTSTGPQQAPTLPGGVNFIVPPQTGGPPPAGAPPE
jgi:hypothetical protein